MSPEPNKWGAAVGGGHKTGHKTVKIFEMSEKARPSDSGVRMKPLGQTPLCHALSQPRFVAIDTWIWFTAPSKCGHFTGAAAPLLRLQPFLLGRRCAQRTAPPAARRLV